ncbi:hypothetical protein [Zunongwangia sp. H14]|uniref:hypothetical protein n=1 Tax=Zunongwangia sp. H14 TaxID=3240792 RepID=UPI003566417A
MKQKIIFLNSFLPRTGHNFTAEVIKVFSNHEVLAHSRSETRLSSILESYYEVYDKKILFDSDREFMDELFINDLRQKIVRNSSYEYIMIKDTSFVGVERLPFIFPDDFHFILIRDPKAVFLSLLKGMNLQKKCLKNEVKKWGIPMGFYPYSYSKKLSNQVLEVFPKMEKHFIIRYEDLVNKDEKLLMELKEKFNTPKSLEKIKKEIEEINVINSSFYKEVGATKIWDGKPKTDKFNPINRKLTNPFLRKGIEAGSLKLRKKLGYI